MVAPIVIIGIIAAILLFVFGTVPLSLAFLSHGKMIMWIVIIILVYYFLKRKK